RLPRSLGNAGAFGGGGQACQNRPVSCYSLLRPAGEEMSSKYLAFVMSVVAGATLSAQEPPPTEPQAQTPALVRPGVPPPGLEPQPYDKVITKDAKTRKGVFTVHQVKEKFFYEIPKE